MKRLTAFLLCLMLCLPPAVLAEEWGAEADEWGLEYMLDAAPGFDGGANATWKTIGAKKGAKLPVYSAPFDGAWRGAKGKAALSTGESFRLLGAAQGGQWLMVEYSVDRNARRVGWIRTPDGTDGNSLFEYTWQPRRLLCGVTRSVSFTDDPRAGKREVRKLAAGEEVIAMFSLESKGTLWAYVETAVDGKPAWGFIPLDALKERPLGALEGNRVVVREGVTCIGEIGEWSYDPETGEGLYTAEIIEPGDIWSPGIYLWDDYRRNAVDEIILPSTLRRLGGEALLGGSVGTLRLGGRLSGVSSYATYGTDIDRIVMAADYTGEVIVGEHTQIGAYEVEPGNPCYASADGVLFSADRKTLIRYPNGRRDSHYNVPAGTEAIAARAFTDDGEGLPLTSISLPIGLKSIGAYAFTGCTRLLSLTVPLTVTQLDPTAFDTCVSLERLSLPPGLSAVFDDGWAERPDFTHYNGDNGSTGVNRPQPQADGNDAYDENDRSVFVYLAAPDGESPVPGYRNPEDSIPAYMLPTGYQATVSVTGSGRGKVYVYGSAWEESFDAWVDLSMMRPCVNNAFFTVTGGEPNEAGLAADAWKGHDPREAVFYCVNYYRNDLVTFSFPDNAVAEVPATLATLYCEDSGTGRMGVLVADRGGVTGDVSPTVQLFDAPGGAAAGFAFAGEQVLILEERDGWFRVKALRTEGWAPAERVAEVFPLPQP